MGVEKRACVKSLCSSEPAINQKGAVLLFCKERRPRRVRGRWVSERKSGWASDTPTEEGAPPSSRAHLLDYHYLRGHISSVATQSSGFFWNRTYISATLGDFLLLTSGRKKKNGFGFSKDEPPNCDLHTCCSTEIINRNLATWEFIIHHKYQLLSNRETMLYSELWWQTWHLKINICD